MRKGFTLTLTALVTAFMATSALALGPTVSNVPDVYIGPQVETATNMFRYTDALVLWDYVAPGVLIGNGSTSDTLYWASAWKNADLNGGTGAYLTPGSGDIHYTIIQDNAQVGTEFAPTQPQNAQGIPTTPLGVAEANTAIGTNAQHSVGAAGALSFRNIRLSPIPDTLPRNNTPAPGVPAGYLEIQEATLYVSDSVTTPGADKILVVTLPTGGDFLSGGPVWELTNDYSTNTSTGWSSLRLVSSNNYGGAATLDPAALTVANNNTGTLTVTSTGANPTNSFYYGSWFANVSVVPNYIYRFKGDISSNNASAASNPTVLFQLNARATGIGLGMELLNGGSALGPTTGNDKSMAGYLVPAQAGTAQATFAVYDPGTNVGAVSAKNLKIHRVPLADLGTGTTKYASGATFNVVASGDSSGGSFQFFEVAYATAAAPTWTHQPAGGGSGAQLILSAVTPSPQPTPARVGLQSFEAKTLFTPTVGNLLVAKVNVVTTAAPTAKLPTLYIGLQGGGALAIDDQAALILDRAGSSGPTTTAADYYVVMTAKAATAHAFYFRTLSDAAGISGDLRVNSFEVKEYTPPTEP